MSEKPLIIFGTGQQSEIITFYLKKMSRNILGYCVDDNFYKKSNFNGKKIITTKELLKKYKPNEIKLHVAISYRKLNQLRYEKYNFFKVKGFSFENIVHNTNFNTSKAKLGENSVILDSYIQPFSKIGNNSFIWSGSTVGHHTSIGNNCWISSGSTIGGNCKIRDFTFLGLNTTIGHFVNIGKKCFIGSSSHITKNISSQSVVIQHDSKKISFDPQKFLEINSFK